LAAGVDRALDLLCRALLGLAALAAAAMLVIVLAAVVMRYAMGAPFRFTEELAGLLLAQVLFLALPWCLHTHAHIRVTLVSERLAGAARRLTWLAGQAILALFCMIFLRELWAITEFTRLLGLRSDQARLLLWPWLAANGLNLLLCAVIALRQALLPPPATGGPLPP
jgi:TRAP-type C4-dicarboxylate transport system permease small subunit